MWVNLDDFATITDYAKLVNRTNIWITTLVKRGKIPYIYHGNKKLIPKTGVMPDYIKDQALIINYLKQK